MPFLTDRQAKTLDLAIERDELCSVCRCRPECSGTKLYPGGPSYPVCADGEIEKYIDTDALDEYLDNEEGSETNA